jgi:hypothetical protein
LFTFLKRTVPFTLLVILQLGPLSWRVILHLWHVLLSFTVVIYDHNDSGQYYKTMITIESYAPNLALALASVVNYDHERCHNLERHLLSVIYDCNVFTIQTTGLKGLPITNTLAF